MHKRILIGALCAWGILLGLSAYPVCAQEPGDYANFSTCSDEEKNEIVTNLFQRQEFGKPEHRQICRELLATQGRFSFANGALFTEAAIDLVEKQGWFEYDNLISEIYKFPSEPRLYTRAFLYLRKRVSRPVPADFVNAWDTIEDSCVAKNKVNEEGLEKAKQRIMNEPDKEMVLVYAISAATSSTGSAATDRCQWIAIDILKTLDQRRVISRLKSFQPHPDTARSIEQVLNRVSDSLSTPQ